MLAIFSNQTNNNIILEEDAALTNPLPKPPEKSCYMGGWIIPPQITKAEKVAVDVKPKKGLNEINYDKFKVIMDIGGSTAATSGSNDPALQIVFPTAHITVPTHQIEDVISLETNFEALPTDFGTADEITSLTYFPVGDYA